MKANVPGTATTIFLLFFGVALIDALVVLEQLTNSGDILRHRADRRGRRRQRLRDPILAGRRIRVFRRRSAAHPSGSRERLIAARARQSSAAVAVTAAWPSASYSTWTRHGWQQT